MAATPDASAQSRQSDAITEDLVNRLRLSINRLHRLLRQESLAGLSPAQASALGLVNRLGSPTLGELAAVEQVQPPTMTRTVGDCTDAGMVTRSTDATDRRSARIRLTPAGKRSLERICTLKNAFLVRRLAELGPAEQAGAADLVAIVPLFLPAARQREAFGAAHVVVMADESSNVVPLPVNDAEVALAQRRSS
jgi:DNA-binding MarR family transcriptional regulator